MTQNGSIIQNAEMKLKDIIATGSFVFSFDIGSVVINVEAGSVIIRLQPLSKHAQETLSFFCQHGGMKDYVLNLLRKKDVFTTLPTGEIYIDVEVSYHTDEVSEEAYISQEALENKNFEVVENPQVIKENLLLQYGSLLEELEPLDLQKIFIGKGILDKSVFEEFTNLQRRARAADFLKKVLHKGNDALNALVVALKDSGRQNLVTKLCFFQKKTTHFGDTEQVNDTLVQVVEEVSNMHADEAVLWSCRLDLLIGRHPDGNLETIYVCKQSKSALCMSS